MTKGDKPRLMGGDANDWDPLHQLMGAPLLAAQEDANLPRDGADCYECAPHPRMGTECAQASLQMHPVVM